MIDVEVMTLRGIMPAAPRFHYENQRALDFGDKLFKELSNFAPLVGNVLNVQPFLLLIKGSSKVSLSIV